jgi:hypothetical protein
MSDLDLQHGQLKRIAKARHAYDGVRNKELFQHLVESEDPHNFSQLMKSNMNSLAKKETPSELIDGVNTTFLMNSTPVSNFVLIFLNGALQEEDESYTQLDNIVEFSIAPIEGDKIKFVYI